jgi:hypothetical protein
VLAGCAGPAPRVASAPAAAADQRPPVRLQAPRVSPDGTTILFAFKYGSLPHNLAVMPSDPAQARISTLEAPPTMAWTDPAWSPDQRHFAAISYCRGGNCYEGAEGHHVWQFTVRPGPDNLQRITLDDGEVRRAEPFFGRSVDDIHWVFSSSWVYERVRWGLHDRFRACAEGRRGKVLFPDDPEIFPIRRPDAGKLNSAPITKSKKFAFSALSPARVFDGTTLYFVGRVRRGTLPLAQAITDTKNRPEPLETFALPQRIGEAPPIHSRTASVTGHPRPSAGAGRASPRKTTTSIREAVAVPVRKQGRKVARK